ncbi:uncharacterized protein LOC122376502, partial [Amphibalanus amphitrite]|uniref:uncharacterized protein LOC122376502 n=1 Tax=Amphibalanus amphitrite TaxID=1232801 RepID=UPI001C91576E
MFIQKGSAADEELDNMLKDWWTTESFGAKYERSVSQSKEDRRAQELLESTTTKLTGNRYETGLLWKTDDDTPFPDSKVMATKRLHGTERRLVNDQEKAAAYQATIDAYVKKGHARKLSREEAQLRLPRCWFLPHHAVTNPNKPGRFRIVFDAAARSYGTSLNDKLLTGPDLLKNLTGVLLRFREEKVGMAADIQEMYHQVRVIEKDRPALSFLWRDLDQTREPDIYEMQVTIFGAKSSPASANYVLQRTVADHGEDCGLPKKAVETVKNSFYMDDFLRSEEHEDDALKTTKQVTETLSRGGFHLSKWVSNSRRVLESIPREKRAQPELDLTEAELPTQGALGVVWDAEKDSLSFRFRDSSVPMTKRGGLQRTASISDPLGIAAPFVIRAKMFMQQLWTKQLDWDDELDHSTHHCSFIMSKTRVAPLKRLSIVRLELQAAVLAVRLVDALQKEIPDQVKKVTYWSDSRVVLQYISNESRRFHTFVSNRVAEIHDLSDKGQWRHCPGRLNPADLCSRGETVKELADNPLWLSGPDFLRGDEEGWPEQLHVQKLAEEDVEVKVGAFATVTVRDPKAALPTPSKFSSWTKYKRTVAWILRFLRNSKLKGEQKRQRNLGPLTVSELHDAEKTILQMVQAEAYRAELHQLQAGQQLNKKSGIADLFVGIDYFGPLTVRRFRKTEKRYGLLVTCLATRAIHLEVSNSLDTDSFLMAFRRFVARRGRPKKVFSDNGTNLKSGERELREALTQWNQQKISDELSQQQIEWCFNPPAASHMGGIWERMIGAVKRALSVVLGGEVTTDEVLSTVFCEIESMINSRPLTHVTDDGLTAESAPYSSRRQQV